MPPAGKRGSKVLVVWYFAVVCLLLLLVVPPLPVGVVCLPLPFVFVGALLLALGLMVVLPVCLACVDDCVFFPLVFVDVPGCDEDC